MNISKTEARTILRCGFVLDPAQDQAIDKILNDLMVKIPAQYILLADSSGQVVSVCGKREQADPVALGALIAGDMAASQEMARLMGDVQSCHLILREGDKSNTWIVNAGNHFVIMFKVAATVPLGWTRVVIHRAAELIAQIADSPLDEDSETPALDFADGDFSDQINQSLEDLWRI